LSYHIWDTHNKMIKIHEINPRMVIRKSRTRSQNCVYCGELIGYDNVALCMNNSADVDLSYRKNLWLHLCCVDKFHKSIKTALKKHGAKITARLI